MTEVTQPQQGSLTAGRRTRVESSRYASTLLSSGVVVGCSVLQGMLGARLLGPEGRGQLAAAILWPTCFASLGLLGVDIAIARQAGQAGDQAPLARTAGLLGALTAGVTSAATWLLLPYLVPSVEHEQLRLAFLAILLVPLSQITMTLRAVDQGAGRLASYNLTRALTNPIYVVALALLWLLGATSVQTVIVALVVANAAPLGILIVSRWTDLFQERGWAKPGPLLREGFRFGVVRIGTELHRRVDQMVLLWLLSVHELGIYVVANSTSALVSLAGGAIGLVGFTHAAQAAPGSGFALLSRDFRRAGVISTLAGIGAIPMLPLVMPLVYGREFEPAIPVAIVMVFGTIFSGLSQVLDLSLRGQGNAYSGLLGRVFAIAAVAGLGYALAPSLGLMGVAIAFVLSQGAYLLVLAIATLRHYNDAQWRALAPAPRDFQELVTAGLTMIKKRSTGRNHP